MRRCHFMNLRRLIPGVAVQRGTANVVGYKCIAAPDSRQVQATQKPRNPHRTARTEVAIHGLGHVYAGLQEAPNRYGGLEGRLIQGGNRRRQRHLRRWRLLPERRRWRGWCLRGRRLRGRRLCGILLTPCRRPQQCHAQQGDSIFLTPPDPSHRSHRLRHHYGVAGLEQNVLFHMLPFDHRLIVERQLLLLSVCRTQNVNPLSIGELGKARRRKHL